MSRRADAPDGGEPQYFWSQRGWWGKVGKSSVAIWGSTGLALVGSIVAARALGPDEYGAVVLALATASFVTLFLDLTLMDGVVHHGFKALESGDTGSLRSLLKAAFLTDLTVGVVVAGILMAIAGPLADIASGGELDPWLVRLAALVGLVMTVDSTTGAILLLARRPDLLGWMMAVTNVTRLLAIVIAIQLDAAPGLIVGSYVLGALVGAVAQVAVARRVAWNEWRRAQPTRSARSWARPLMSFGVHSTLAGTFQSTEKALVPMILGGLAGPAAAGIFNVALLPITVVLTALGPFRLMLLPEQTRLAARGDIGALRKTVRGYTGIALAIAVPGAIAGWFLLPVLIPALFSSQFDDAVEPARIMLAAAVAHFAIGSWSKIFPVAVGWPRLQSVMSGAYMAVSVGLTAALAGGLKSTGGAIATSAAAVSTSVAWWFLAERVLHQEAARAGGPRTPDDSDRRDAEAQMTGEIESAIETQRMSP
jgi:O-antigen/teichoic acid export membrane protein